MQTVLITEDSPPRRQQLDDALRRVGYFTIQADTATQALGILRSVQVDLLVTRERLADVEGSVLAEIARHRGLDELVVLLLADDVPALERGLADGIADAVLARDAEPASVVQLARRLLRPVTIKSPPPAAFTDPCPIGRA